MRLSLIPDPSIGWSVKFAGNVKHRDLMGLGNDPTAAVKHLLQLREAALEQELVAAKEEHDLAL